MVSGVGLVHSSVSGGHMNSSSRSLATTFLLFTATAVLMGILGLTLTACEESTNTSQTTGAGQPSVSTQTPQHAVGEATKPTSSQTKDSTTSSSQKWAPRNKPRPLGAKAATKSTKPDSAHQRRTAPQHEKDPSQKPSASLPQTANAPVPAATPTHQRSHNKTRTHHHRPVRPAQHARPSPPKKRNPSRRPRHDLDIPHITVPDMTLPEVDFPTPVRDGELKLPPGVRPLPSKAPNLAEEAYNAIGELSGF